ncbi:MAG: YraN family protein [Janthinobacterium lividum]
MAEHNSLGRKGEELAKQYLEAAGYEILDENWRFGKAELDLIVYLNKTIIFVEVKARTGSAFGEPEDFVDHPKQKLLVGAANEFIELMDFNGEARFDIIAILFDKQGNYRLNHIQDAFWPDPN